MIMKIDVVKIDVVKIDVVKIDVIGMCSLTILSSLFSQLDRMCSLTIECVLAVIGKRQRQLSMIVKIDVVKIDVVKIDVIGKRH